MKKIFYAISILSLFSLTACNFGLPKSIKVKTKADYNFTIAATKSDFDFDAFASAKLNESLAKLNEGFKQNNSMMRLYGYNPDGKADKKQLLLSMPFQSIPLDFSQYLDKMDFNADSFSPEPFTFTVPEINNSKKVEVDLASIKEVVNGAVSFWGAVSSDSNVEFAVDQADSSSGFDKVIYSNGSINITILDKSAIENMQDLDSIDLSTPSLDCDGAKVRLIFDNDDYIEDYIYGGKATLQFRSGANAITKTGMRICFTGTAPGTIAGFVAVMDENSTVSKVTGLTFDPPAQSIPSQSIPVSLPEQLKVLKIGKGEISFGLELPSTWKETEVEASLTGSFTGLINETLSSNGKISLDGKTLDSGDLNFAGQVKFTFNNATLDFEKDTKFAFAVGMKIETLDTVKYDVGEGLNLSQSLDFELPPEATSMLNSITWKKSGVSISLDHNLPAGNNISITSVKSDFFGIDDSTEKTLSATPVELYCADDTVTTISDGAKVDFAVELNALNYNSADHTVTLKGLEFGKEYKASIKIEPKIDWYLVSINTGALSTPISASMNTGLDLATMIAPVNLIVYGGTEEDESIPADNLLKYINISSLPVYLDCCVPSYLNNLKFAGSITVGLVDDEASSDSDIVFVDGTEVVVLGNVEADNTVSSAELVSSTAAYKPEFKDGVVISNLSDIKNHTDLAKIINCGKSGALGLNYSVGLSGSSGDLVIVNPDYETEAPADALVPNGEVGEIAISFYIPLSLDFDIKEDLNLNLLSMIPGISESENNSDLFGRTEPTDANFQNYLDVIETVELNYNLKEIPLEKSGDPIQLKVSLIDGATNKTIVDTPLDLSKGKISLNPGQVLAAYPLKATAELVIPKGKIYVPQLMKFAADLTVSIHTNGEIELTELKASE